MACRRQSQMCQLGHPADRMFLCLYKYQLATQLDSQLRQLLPSILCTYLFAARNKVYPYEINTREIHAYKTPAHEMHTREMYTRKIYAHRSITFSGYECCKGVPPNQTDLCEIYRAFTVYTLASNDDVDSLHQTQ